METEKTLQEKFQEWLKEQNATVTVAVRTPQGELISTDNFIYTGWTVVVGVIEKKG